LLNLKCSKRSERNWTSNQFTKPLPKKSKTIQEALESKEESKGFYGDLTRLLEPITIGSRHPISLVKPNHRYLFKHWFSTF
jgi:phenylalanyl-tRNA synthetase alpha chain